MPHKRASTPSPKKQKKRTAELEPDRLDQLQHEWAASGRVMNYEFAGFVVGMTIIDQLIQREYKRFLDLNYDMSVGDFRILLALHRAPHQSLRPTDLFKSLLVTSGAITKQVNRLEERGFVRRVFNSQRRGSWLIALTKSGKTLIDNFEGKHATPITYEAFYALSKKQRLEIMNAVHAIIREIQARTRVTPID